MAAKVFLDIEANQVVNDRCVSHELLQIGAIKIDDQQRISKFNLYVKYHHYINKKVLYLVQKTPNFFWKQKYDEAAVYFKFKEFCKNCELYAYGEYDQIVLNAAASRYDQNYKWEINDYAIILAKQYGFSSNYKPSQQAWLNVLNIQCFSSHDGLADAEALFNIYKKINKHKYNINNIRRAILFDGLRPNLNTKDLTPFVKGEITNPEINDNYYFLFDYSSIKPIKVSEKVNQYQVYIEIKKYYKNATLVSVEQLEQTFDSKDKAMQFAEHCYAKYFVDKKANFVLVHTNTLLAKIYRKATKGLLLFYNVKFKKIDSYIPEIRVNFKTIAEKESKIISLINKFYVEDKKDFSKLFQL